MLSNSVIGFAGKYDTLSVRQLSYVSSNGRILLLQSLAVAQNLDCLLAAGDFVLLSWVEEGEEDRS